MTEKKEKKKIQTEEYYPAEEQGILPEETSEEITEEMRLGEKESDVYTDEGREELIEEDEIENWEEGFMEGALGGEQLRKDALTGEPLEGEGNVEIEIEGKKYYFVNQENAEKFREKLEIKRRDKKKE